MVVSSKDAVVEGERLLDQAAAAEVQLKLTGGVAIAKICPSAREHPALVRSYSDIDFVGTRRAAGQIERFFAGVGYHADSDFNDLHGEHRLYFLETGGDREADVFLDEIRACHVLDLRDRLDLWPETITPADLLLSKLQVVETNQKDYQDIFAVVLDHEVTQDESGIGLPRIVELCSKDWGWWRTVMMVIERSIVVSKEMLGVDGGNRVSERLEHMRQSIDDAPKSRRWKLRARVGDRVPWHDEPEEVAHD